MTESKNKIIVLRTNKCRKSDAFIRYLKEYGLPHLIMYLETDPEAQRLAKKYHIQSSPGIIAGGRVFNPHDIIQKCLIKDPEKIKNELLKAIQSSQ